MTTIGDLNLRMVGSVRVRTEYEGATIEGIVTGFAPEIRHEITREWGGKKYAEHFAVTLDLTLGSIELHGLSLAHRCEVIA